ncbi:MAG: TAXI family TRAP transporter solute-binding subunit [Alphaproteobacteria bacterium]|jgi:TRAP transporter TAXI family solute receptor|nr:TAXI family TRAP transporter solute-binding subunit [Alphaproteobacteria bacterium]
MKSLTYAAVLAGSLAYVGAAAAQVAVFATNPQGSLGYRTGIAVAKTVTAKADGVTGRPQPMGGSTTYIPIVNRGEVGFGFSNGLETYFAYNGTGTFEGRAQSNLRMVGRMFPLRTGIVARADLGATSIHDLKKLEGKRITSKYTSLSIIEIFIKGALANGNTDYSKFKKVPVSGFAKGMFALGEGKTDISWISLGSGAGRKVNTQLRSSGGFVYLDMDTSPAATKRFSDIMPAAKIVLESNTKMPGIKKPTNIVEIDYVLFTHKGMDNELVYKVTKALATNKAHLAKSMGAFNRLKPETFAEPDMAPYHPGALKAIKELGLKIGS